jgi:hypothetical protein
LWRTTRGLCCDGAALLEVPLAAVLLAGGTGLPGGKGVERSGAKERERMARHGRHRVRQQRYRGERRAVTRYEYTFAEYAADLVAAMPLLAQRFREALEAVADWAAEVAEQRRKQQLG